MNTRPICLILFSCMVLIALAGVPTLWAQGQQMATVAPITEVDGKSTALQLENVRRLLETSSGAQKVQGSDKELSKKIHQDARDRFREAESAYKSGQYETADRLLIEVAQTMFQAIRMMGPVSEIVDKKINDFKRREESLQVLLKALQRISADEGKEGPTLQRVTEVRGAIAAALVLQKDGRHDEAREVLDAGYEIAKAGLNSLRDGKTLVRSLTFENDEAEFKYEMDRNDTHHMLVRVLKVEKRPGAQASKIVDVFVEKAGKLRVDAEQKADDGDFRDAIHLLELSTKELVRAIRNLGVYIPG